MKTLLDNMKGPLLCSKSNTIILKKQTETKMKRQYTMKIKRVLALATAIMKNMSKRRRTIIEVIVFLILCVIYAANVQMFHINEEGIDVNGIRFPLFYERIDAKIPISNEETVYIELKTTPFSKSTYYECGTESSYAKLNCSSGEFHIKTSSLSENNTWDEIAEGTKAREEVGSDFYSPLLHHSAEGYASGEGLRLNTDFGLYEIR